LLQAQPQVGVCTSSNKGSNAHNGESKHTTKCATEGRGGRDDKTTSALRLRQSTTRTARVGPSQVQVQVGVEVGMGRLSKTYVVTPPCAGKSSSTDENRPGDTTEICPGAMKADPSDRPNAPRTLRTTNAIDKNANGTKSAKSTKATGTRNTDTTNTRRRPLILMELTDPKLEQVLRRFFLHYEQHEDTFQRMARRQQQSHGKTKCEKREMGTKLAPTGAGAAGAGVAAEMKHSKVMDRGGQVTSKGAEESRNHKGQVEAPEVARDTVRPAPGGGANDVQAWELPVLLLFIDTANCDPEGAERQLKQAASISRRIASLRHPYIEAHFESYLEGAGPNVNFPDHGHDHHEKNHLHGHHGHDHDDNQGGQSLRERDSKGSLLEGTNVPLSHRWAAHSVVFNDPFACIQGLNAAVSNRLLISTVRRATVCGISFLRSLNGSQQRLRQGITKNINPNDIEQPGHYGVQHT